MSKQCPVTVFLESPTFDCRPRHLLRAHRWHFRVLTASCNTSLYYMTVYNILWYDIIYTWDIYIYICMYIYIYIYIYVYTYHQYSWNPLGLEVRGRGRQRDGPGGSRKGFLCRGREVVLYVLCLVFSMTQGGEIHISIKQNCMVSSRRTGTILHSHIWILTMLSK